MTKIVASSEHEFRVQWTQGQEMLWRVCIEKEAGEKMTSPLGTPAE
jgi:hypothetical protein